MIWITKYRHNKIVAQYQEAIDDLKATLNRKETMEKILDKLTDKISSSDYLTASTVDWVTSSGELILPPDVPRYVEDYFGGKVIKQEAHPVTILDENGKATYGVTAKKPEKNKRYVLHEKCKDF